MNQVAMETPTHDMIELSLCIFKQLIKLYPSNKQPIVENLITKTQSLHQLWESEFLTNTTDDEQFA